MTVCLRIRFRPDFFPPQDAGDEAAAEIRVYVFQYSRRSHCLCLVCLLLLCRHALEQVPRGKCGQVSEKERARYTRLYLTHTNTNAQTQL